MGARAGRCLRGRTRKFYQELIENLTAYARHVFELGAPAAGGGALRDHLEQVARQTGKQPRQLAEEPELWAAAEHIWEWFLELHAARPTALGPQPISYGEIAAWATVNRLSPQLWELDALRAVDGSWRSALAASSSSA